jgi:hypothetical protein
MTAMQERLVAIALLCCVGTVAFWLIASQYASRGFEPLRLGQGDFEGFLPLSDSWQSRLVYVKSTPTEPTITAYELRPVIQGGAPVEPGGDAPVLVRIVHGYNMVDCMRIKHYGVDLLGDNLQVWRGYEGGQGQRPVDAPPVQIWRLREPQAAARVWVSSMLLAADFSGTAVDTRDMAFPRVGTPDEPAYRPTGLRWRSLRHPLRNFRLFLRSRWNASRSDFLTFLRLRQPAWASDVLLTMVSEYRGGDAAERTDAEMQAHVLAAHRFFYGELQRFAAAKN